MGLMPAGHLPSLSREGSRVGAWKTGNAVQLLGLATGLEGSLRDAQGQRKLKEGDPGSPKGMLGERSLLQVGVMNLRFRFLPSRKHKHPILKTVPSWL